MCEKSVKSKTIWQFFIPLTFFLLSIHLTSFSVLAEDLTSVSNYHFRFKVPLNISNAKEHEIYTGSSEFTIQCDVFTSSDVLGLSGSKTIQSKNYKYNGLVIVDVKNRATSSQTPLHKMSKYRCALQSREYDALGPGNSGEFSEESIKVFAAPGSVTVVSGNL